MLCFAVSWCSSSHYLPRSRCSDYRCFPCWNWYTLRAEQEASCLPIASFKHCEGRMLASTARRVGKSIVCASTCLVYTTRLCSITKPWSLRYLIVHVSTVYCIGAKMEHFFQCIQIYSCAQSRKTFYMATFYFSPFIHRYRVISMVGI